MSCPDYELLSAFADGELTPVATAEIEHHLSACESCAAFVREVRELDRRARTALQGIRVPTRPKIVSLPVTPAWARWRRAITLAAALAVIGLSAGVWFIAARVGSGQPKTSPRETVASPSSTNSAVVVSASKSAADGPFSAAADAAFERWAAPYRRLHIPLVPMEEVANYRPPKILPVRPLTRTPNGKG